MSLRERAVKAFADHEAEARRLEQEKWAAAWELQEQKSQDWSNAAKALFGDEPDHIEYWDGWFGGFGNGNGSPDQYVCAFIYCGAEQEDTVYLQPYEAKEIYSPTTIKFKLIWPCPLCNAILVARWPVESMEGLGEQLGQLERGELLAYEHDCEYAKKEDERERHYQDQRN